MKQETFEEIKVIKRTELYNSILSIVKQIPRKEVDGDAVDAPSCAYELEQLFLKWQQEQEKITTDDAYNEGFENGKNWQQERSYSEEEVWKLVNKLNETLNIGSDLTLEEWFEKFKKK